MGLVLMTDEERQLAVLLRQTQWLLDDLAHALPTGQVPATKRNEAANILTSVASLLRVTTPIVIDHPNTTNHDDQ
jgi:predicted RNA-binding protein associated with RNAse of E/G family